MLAENVLSGGAGDDVLSATITEGTPGESRLFGGQGDDVLEAVGGTTNRLDGGRGADSMSGGSGNDVYYVDDGADSVTEEGDSSEDSVIASVTWTLGANCENLTLAGSGRIHGHGNDLANTISGNTAGNFLRGYQGADILLGGGGADKLCGGLGNDTFAFDLTSDSTPATRDAIVGGNRAEAFEGAGIADGDRIDLSAIDAIEGTPGDQQFIFGGSGAGHLSLSNSGRHTLVQANTDDDEAFEFELIIRDGDVLASDYLAADFVL